MSYLKDKGVIPGPSEVCRNVWTDLSEYFVSKVLMTSIVLVMF